MHSRLLALPALLLILLCTPVRGDAPPGYYDSVDTQTKAALRASLHALIDAHSVYPYTSSSTDTWDILEQADQDPGNASNILDVYRNQSIAKFGGGTGPYNREHTWPNSYGFPSSGATPYTDCHHLFLCDPSYNSSRGNKPFADVSASGTERPTVFNDGQGGGTGIFPGYSNWYDTQYWQVWSGRKGDVARALLYLDVRYEGSGEPDLILTDNPALIVTTGGVASIAYMGLLTVLRDWHAADPVDAREQHRNDVVYSFQGNRNPFIDHPEWVEMLWGEATATPPVLLPLAITSVYPNPMNPLSRLTFTLSQPGMTRVDVFGLDGRLVRTLLNELRPAGSFGVEWDGTNAQGVAVASGTYLFRLANGSASDARKVVLLK